MADDGSARMVLRTVRICNQRGLHARAAAKFVKLAGSFDAQVTVQRNGIQVGGDSIMGLMVLAAAQGCEVTLEATGPEAEDAVGALEELVARGFDET
jgi:phosphocarrier protein